MKTPVGASLEVLEHAGNLHARRCPDASAVTTVWPRGASSAIICSTCAEPVFVAALPGTWCAHIAGAIA